MRFIFVCCAHVRLVSQVFLASMDDFVAVNGVYAKAFGSHKPARSAVQVARLPLNALVEIEAIARYVSDTLHPQLPQSNQILLLGALELSLKE